MQKITRKILDDSCEKLNKFLKTKENNRFEVHSSYDRVQLVQFINDKNDRNVSPLLTNRELYDFITAYILGAEYERNKKL